MFVVIISDMIRGCPKRVIGPFKSEEAAHEYCLYLDCKADAGQLGEDDDFGVFNLEAPE